MNAGRNVPNRKRRRPDVGFGPGYDLVDDSTPETAPTDMPLFCSPEAEINEETFRSWRATVIAKDGTRVEILATREEYEDVLADTIRILREVSP